MRHALAIVGLLTASFSNASDLPAGTVLKGLALTSATFTTGPDALRDPLPFMVRITEGPQKNCMVLASGHADKEMKKVNARIEKLSCISAQGALSEESIGGFAIDTDRQLGLPGEISVLPSGELQIRIATNDPVAFVVSGKR